MAYNHHKARPIPIRLKVRQRIGHRGNQSVSIWGIELLNGLKLRGVRSTRTLGNSIPDLGYEYQAVMPDRELLSCATDDQFHSSQIRVFHLFLSHKHLLVGGNDWNIPLINCSRAVIKAVPRDRARLGRERSLLDYLTREQ